MTAPAPRSAVVVGLMSGTSLDGVSAAATRLTLADDGGVGAELLGFVQQPYAPAQRSRLLAALREATPAEYCRLNVELGEWLADAALAAIAAAGLQPRDVAAVASHGQTVWHEPGHSTWQIGEPAVIAERTGRPVVSGFRARDMAAGGQGAPLVPIADRLLFAAPHRWRLLQNLGGIGNVTVVPPGGDAAHVRAFDTGPGVCVIDAVVRRLRPALPYDVDGRLALAGTVVDAVVDALLAEPYFASAPPKSTGRELFSDAYVDRFLAACRAARPDARDEDLVATAVALTGRSIGDAYRRFVPEPADETVLSGGGARNPALVAAIRDAVSPRRVRLF
ncbi:MAG TPA: anhydro-N-acetylmuramic acid kinase, partial [Gemmatimonadaceae bacterium]|nr:anhydro-N-acetylmuramic acid kinase [Gemmatimonadaceae bacterium]